MKTIDEHYKDWCGEHHTVNSAHPVHDSSECCDFAEYYHAQVKQEKDKAQYQTVSRYEKRNQQRAVNSMNTIFIYLCKKFAEGLWYEIQEEFILIDQDRMNDLCTKLDNLWRAEVNAHKGILGDKFTQNLHAFTETCNAFMEQVKDRVYVQYLLKLIAENETYPITGLSVEKLAEYRKSGMNAKDAAHRVVLHEQSVINTLKT